MKVLVVGTGAGGSTAARELSKKGFEVVIFESGRPFTPFRRGLSLAKPLRRAGLLDSEKIISRFFKHMSTQRSSKDLVLVRGITTGGSTTLTCGNIVRATRGLDEIGLDLTSEFEELEKIIGINPIPKSRWRPITKQMFNAALELGLKPQLTPKAVEISKCVSCGLCELGCATGARWDSRRFLNEAIDYGAVLHTSSTVQKVLVEKNNVTGVLVRSNRTNEKLKFDNIVLAAGGIGTAQILRNSRLPVENKLWADVVLTLGGIYKDACQLKEPPMTWYVKKEDYIISPYIDILSHWFHKPWQKVSLENRVGVMVKLADSANGSVSADGSVIKRLTKHDRARLNEGISIITDIMKKVGVSGPYIEGLLNGGHLGGTVPLQKQDISTMHPSSLPEGLWVADLSLVPRSQGLPTMLLSAALALKVARSI